MKLLLLILISFPVCVSAQEKNVPAKDYLKGNVKSIRESEYKARRHGAKKRRPTNTSAYTYNGSGNETEVTFYNRRGAITYKLGYGYDEKGQRVTGNESLKDDKAGPMSKYSYDAKGNLLEQDEYNSDYTLLNKHQFKYDNDGHQTEYASYRADGSLDFKTANKFDGAGNDIEEDYYGNDGNFEFKITYTYDANGNESELDYYKADGRLDHKLTYKYEYYDNMGNWQKETTYENGKPVIVTERKIAYN